MPLPATARSIIKVEVDKASLAKAGRKIQKSTGFGKGTGHSVFPVLARSIPIRCRHRGVGARPQCRSADRVDGRSLWASCPGRSG